MRKRIASREIIRLRPTEDKPSTWNRLIAGWIPRKWEVDDKYGGELAPYREIRAPDGEVVLNEYCIIHYA